jgi:aspartyl-tRNA(Asn)/glutamyl-tRNA(Gln) amidotransferase subunit A
MSKLHHLSVQELSQQLSQQKISSVELTTHFLERSKSLDEKTKAYISLNEEQALEQAKQADAARAKNNCTPLTGIPIALKDIYCVDGGKTTCASRMLENFIAPYNATVTAKVFAQNMPLLGKLNMDEFAMGSTTETSYFGSTHNPWDLNAIPGGSSGGSAAAVAARLTPLSVGTDTGGSIRQPAACCGITGLKPTYGVVSRWGQIAFASSLDQGGPMAKSAADCAFLLDVISGFDEKDSTSIQQPETTTSQHLEDSISGKKIGVPYHLFEQDQKILGKANLEHLTEAIEEYKKLGCEIVNIEIDNLQSAIAAYYIIASAEASSNLSRYDGVRYGYRCQDPVDLMDLYKRSRSEGFGEEVKRRLMIGTYVLSAGYFDAYYLQAQKVRQIITNQFQNTFSQVEAILLPAKPGSAFNLNSHNQDPVNVYMEDIFTIPVNLAGLPAMALPIGFDEKKRPLGMQLIGNYKQEHNILNIAHQYQKNTDWHLQTPPNFD